MAHPTNTIMNVMKMIKINDEAHKKPNKILGELTARNGEKKTFDDVLNFLIEKY